MTASAQSRTITVRDEDDRAYTITEMPGFSDISTADGYGYFVCEDGPVICIAPNTYEIWLTGEWGPYKVIARSCDERQSGIRHQASQ